MNQVTSNIEKNIFREPRQWLKSLGKFSRPHTIIGTSLSVLALFLIAIALSNISLNWTIFNPLIFPWTACLCGNVYIVGLNQLQDVSIDKINKPNLPIASGEFSEKQAQWIVNITGILAIIIAVISSQWLLLTITVSLAIGTAYSLPPIRLKRFPFWAALCIFTVRGVIVNLGLFLHFNQTINQQQLIPPAIWALTLFILIFTIAIAIFKDVPDLEGDKQYNITTFTLLLGKNTILNITRIIISVCYLGVIIASFLLLPDVNPLFVGMTHGSLFLLLWWRSQTVDLENKSSIAQFYQFIWKLFYLEYLLFPIACFLA
ncbi:homogentisate phytyltransferase [Dactylococcopsis salina]|uniref:4-hydroxybenzoate polyprenyltransferase-like prenyltransferase n=1 Tax=Dactylococcopsis salina (strain PCC 8305) TaxID=13035 RepID=K9YUY9_DACS8|nr:homogentisate phytyltransferase [Dactylococcopsis salina]AFZ50165.1 4-hydroxybenzoate polyprenyltransferase-like prenyltransferase [Dactylococcopsis salina PCC 8305]